MPGHPRHTEALLPTQGVGWIHPAGAAGGHVGGKQSDQQEQPGRGGEGHRIAGFADVASNVCTEGSFSPFNSCTPAET